MARSQSLAVVLAERLCRPQRVGVFGHRGAGKTTLLTMLYREAVGGRLPGLRLAAAHPRPLLSRGGVGGRPPALRLAPAPPRTADYLSDKVLQLEAPQPLPATLGET